MNKVFLLGTVLCVVATPLRISASAIAGSWLESGLQSVSLVPASMVSVNEPAVKTPVTQGLLNLVMNKLKMSRSQAENSLGGLFQLAKENLSVGEYAQVSAVVPGINAQVALAPELQEDSSILGGLLAQAGSEGKALQGANYMKSILAKQEIPLEQLMPLVELTSGYLKQHGDANVYSLFNQALSI
ncbi:MAG: DUF2780 domain-containing protein [Endozoicomonadaceae bacterium]|nr:DUF2780 domain-containing protein [Endozoicomonadaceae bacterium]